VLLRQFNLYDLFIVAFAQFDLDDGAGTESCREFDTRFPVDRLQDHRSPPRRSQRVAISALACFVTYEVWAKPVGGLETAAYLLAIFGVVVIVLRPDTGVVGSFPCLLSRVGIHLHSVPADVAASATHSIAEA